MLVAQVVQEAEEREMWRFNSSYGFTATAQAGLWIEDHGVSSRENKGVAIFD